MEYSTEFSTKILERKEEKKWNRKNITLVKKFLFLSWDKLTSFKKIVFQCKITRIGTFLLKIEENKN